jgi:hypothetical protein
MAEQVVTVERAFDLARSSTCRHIADIQTSPTAEDYPDVLTHITGGLEIA